MNSLNILLLIIYFVCFNTYSQTQFRPVDLGLTIKQGNIDRSKLDQRMTVAADFNNDMLQDIVKYDVTDRTLKYYINEGNGFLVLSKNIQVGLADYISLMQTGKKENSIAIHYGPRIRIITQSELNFVQIICALILQLFP